MDRIASRDRRSNADTADQDLCQRRAVSKQRESARRPSRNTANESRIASRHWPSKRTRGKFRVPWRRARRQGAIPQVVTNSGCRKNSAHCSSVRYDPGRCDLEVRPWSQCGAFALEDIGSMRAAAKLAVSRERGASGGNGRHTSGGQQQTLRGPRHTPGGWTKS